MNPRLPLLAAVAVAPRRTMRWMLDHPERRQSFAVVFAAWVSWSIRDFSWTEMRRASEAFGISASMLIAIAVILLGGLFSLLFFFVLSAAATGAGRFILGGTGSFGDVRTALAWGLAPQVWALIYRLPAIMFWPDAVAALTGGKRRLQVGSAEPDLDFSFVAGPVAPMIVFGLLELACLVWYLVTGSRTLAEAQRFSPARGLANLLIAVVLPFIVILVIAAAAWLAVATT